MQADDWILFDKAPERVGRSKSTLYRWVKDEKVRELRLQGKVFLNVPDLLDAERTRRGRPRAEIR